MAEFQLDVTSTRRTRKGAGGPGAAPAAPAGEGGKLPRKRGAAPKGAGKLRRRKAHHEKSKARTAKHRESSRARSAIVYAAIRALATKTTVVPTRPVEHIPRPEWMHPRAYHVACAGIARVIDKEPRNWGDFLTDLWRKVREAQASATGKPCERLPSGHPFTKERIERYMKTAAERARARGHALGGTEEVKLGASKAGRTTKVRKQAAPARALDKVQQIVIRLVKSYVGVSEDLSAMEHSATVTAGPKLRARVETKRSYWGGQTLSLTVPTRWYTRVHLRGLSILDGRLVLDAEPLADNRWSVTYVHSEASYNAEQGKDERRYYIRHGFVSRRGPGFLALVDDVDANVAERAADMAQALDVL